jgi:hypothetical protein
VQLLGQRRVGEQAAFEVAANTASITIVQQSVNAPSSITFQPAGGSSLTLSNTAVPLVVIDPARKVIYDDNPAVRVNDPNQIALQPAFFASTAAGIGTLTFPNTTGGLALSQPSGFPAGTWTLTVSDLAYKCTFEQPAGACCAGGSTSSLYDVMVITKQTSTGAISSTGRLDVVVYFATNAAGGARPGTTSAPLSAATANAGLDPDLVRMQATLSRIFANAGITIGSVRYVDLPAATQARYASGVNIDDTGPCSDLAQLFKSADPGNTLNIFFVRSLIASDLGTTNEVVGVDGTIPGPSTVGGSVGSGAAVATLDLRRTRDAFNNPLCPGGTIDPIRCGPDVTAYIIAHEAGHFLGLYHVTESEGTSFDPLRDTPMCPCLQCALSSARAQCASAIPAPAGTPHSMSVSECSASATCGGGDNLMFWLLEPGSSGTIISEQGSVMRANPLVQ